MLFFILILPERRNIEAPFPVPTASLLFEKVQLVIVEFDPSITHNAPPPTVPTVEVDELLVNVQFLKLKRLFKPVTSPLLNAPPEPALLLSKVQPFAVKVFVAFWCTAPPASEIFSVKRQLFRVNEPASLSIPPPLAV